MAQYCTIADLSLEVGGDDYLAALADDVNSPPDLNDATTQEVLNRAITDASNAARSALIGRVDFSDTQVLEDLRRFAVTPALYKLHIRRGHFGPANPYNDLSKAITQELKAIREGKLNTGVTSTPVLTASNAGGDDPPVFAPDADGDNAFMDQF